VRVDAGLVCRVGVAVVGRVRRGYAFWLVVAVGRPDHGSHALVEVRQVGGQRA